MSKISVISYTSVLSCVLSNRSLLIYYSVLIKSSILSYLNTSVYWVKKIIVSSSVLSYATVIS